MIGAYRDDASRHVECRRWLDRAAAGPSPFGLSETAVAGFLRIVTDQRIFNKPEPMAKALEFADWLRDRPATVMISPGPRHWEIMKGLCRLPGVQGPLVTDAWFAALAIEHGCEWVTLDGDFKRFPGLRVVSPLED